jgi:hypothetical protein
MSEINMRDYKSGGANLTLIIARIFVLLKETESGQPRE